MTTREYVVRERILHVWPYSDEKYLKYIISSLSYCVIFEIRLLIGVTSDKNDLRKTDAI